MAFGFGFALTAIAKAVGFTPRSLFTSGEQGVWYDPSDFSTMFQDAAGTTPVTAVEQPVGRILDKSGRGNHATQTTTTSRPVLQQDASGRYYLLFDGVDDSLVTPNINFTGTDKMTVFAGSRYFGNAPAIMVELSTNASAVNGSFVAAVNDFSVGMESCAGRVTFTAGTAFTAPNNTTRITTRQIDFAQPTSSTEFLMRINGVIQTPINATVSTAGSGTFGNYPLFIGRRGGTSLPFNGRIYSLIVRGAQSTAQQISDTETWVNGKTGAY